MDADSNADNNGEDNTECEGPLTPLRPQDKYVRLDVGPDGNDDDEKENVGPDGNDDNNEKNVGPDGNVDMITEQNDDEKTTTLIINDNMLPDSDKNVW